jgi:tetratricopeptide (TPR) repeat protein
MIAVQNKRSTLNLTLRKYCGVWQPMKVVPITILITTLFLSWETAHLSKAIASSPNVAADSLDVIFSFDRNPFTVPKVKVDLFQRGNSKQDNEDYLGAISDYTEYLKTNPRHANAYRNRGFCRAMLGDLRGSLDDFNVALGIDPRHADTYNARGNVRAMTGKLKSSIRDFDRAIRLDRNFADAYYNRALSRHGLKDLRGAKADLLTASELFRKQKDLGGYHQAVSWIEKLR